MTMRQIEIDATGDRPLMADLHQPEGKGPWPLVVGVSGGGWVKGHRRVLNPWGAWLAKKGIAFASIDYRRAETEAVFPGNVKDVVQALSFFAESGSDFDLEARNMIVLGVSAGAHLSSLALLSNAFETPNVAGFIGVYGVYDLMVHWQADLWRNAAPGADKTVAMLGATPFDDPQLYHSASPLRQITYDKAFPTLLIWGQLDREVLPEYQSAAFSRALQQAHFPVRNVELPDAGHLWFSEDGPEVPGSHSSRVAPDIFRFIKRQIGQ
ncbi:alpha/beta hydrolase [Halomonas sp. BL6]|uniref:alpha/beta hydrolase n=1 Tax=Halomonas sp. BL6 TaxID=2585770 RepID=UPI00111AC213|nr:alpha/beta hydrolase [Halomonas sp. BL6]TNH14115.1 alpha/beta hydrolase [Halomonas sp. BL6]